MNAAMDLGSRRRRNGHPDTDPQPKKTQKEQGVVGRQHNLGKALLWLSTTAAAAVIGAVVTSYFERPAPSTTITGLSISPKYNEVFDKNTIVKVSLNDSIFNHLKQGVWVKDIEESEIKLSTLTETLSDDENTVEKIVKDMDNLRTELPDLKALLSAPPNTVAAETFLDKWEQVDTFIYASLVGKLERGEFTSPPEKKHDGQVPYLLLQQDRSEQKTYYYVSKRGGLRRTVITLASSQQANDARALANALAYFDQDLLMKYLDVAASELTDYWLYEELVNEVPRYLHGYARWLVTVFVANSGSHPISFSPTATLYVNSVGANAVKGYTIIDLESRASDGELAPVSLEGGHSEVVNFASKALISADKNWRDLLSLFDSRARKCFIVLHPQSEFWNRGSDLTSAVRVFGSGRAPQRLTDKEIADRFAE